MLKSMTGYGKSELEVANKKITLEVKSLNSKSLDLSTRIASLYREKDIEIRKIIAEKAIRGKVEFSLYIESLGGSTRTKINEDVVHNYFLQLKQISNNNQVIGNDIHLLTAALKLPDALKTELDSLDENEWKNIEAKLIETLDALNDFREQEGLSLENDLRDNITRIQQLLEEVKPFEEARVANVKQRLTDSLKDLELSGKIDNNRLEQELIFYIEKLDVNEEKVRLAQHCSYFLETMSQNTDDAGKKLGFIAQEIGREINTLGSKANESNMQRIVVQMKDSLERIKEQVLNVL